MIISHKHKFIFIKTKKTGGSSLEMALRQITGTEDIVTPLGLDEDAYVQSLKGSSPSNYHYPIWSYDKRDWYFLFRTLKRPRFKMHQTATEIKQKVSPQVWSTYFKFAVERNPFDKIISFYNHSSLKSERIRSMSLSELIRSNVLNRMGAEEFYSLNGKLIVDRLYRFGDFDLMLQDIASNIEYTDKLQMPSLKAKSQYRVFDRDYMKYYDESDKQVVMQRFSNVFNLLTKSHEYRCRTLEY